MNSMQLNLLLDAILYGKAQTVTAYAQRERDRLVAKGYLDASFGITEEGRKIYESLA